MTIRKKLLLSFGMVLVIMLLAFVVSMVTMLRERSTKSATKRAMELSLTAGVVRFHMMQSRLSLSNYLLTGDAKEVEKLRAEQRQFAEALQVAKSNAQTDAARAQLAKLEQVERDWNEKFVNRLLEQRRLVDSGKASSDQLHKAYVQLDPQFWVRSSSDIVDRIRADNQQLLLQRGQTDETSAMATTLIAVVGVPLALVLCLGIAYKTSRSITEPLDELSAVARNIADTGNLNQPLEAKRFTSEVGQLAYSYAKLVDYLKEMASVSEAIARGDLSADIQPRSSQDTLALAFSKMTQGLRALVRAVRDAASQVAAGSNQVADSSEDSAKISVQSASAIDEVTSTMHEMSVNVQNMVRNTQMQASDVGHTSASIEQMVASIQRVADTAKVLLDISNRSREEVQNGLTTMQKATEGLNRINDSIGSSAEIISTLGQSANEIGKIVEVIDDISEQTNLLALNAAIEAARAGEHGLGFAVVADEVRKLAEKSAESAKDISELIDRIQKEARKAVGNMDKSTTIVNEGLGLGGDLNSALRRISNVVTEVYKFAHEIGAATNEQSHGSSQIAKATSRLNEITQSLPEVVEAAARIGRRHAILDGEVIAVDAAGRPLAFQEVMRRFGRVREVERLRVEQPIRLFIFDLLALDGELWIDRPYEERYAEMARLAADAGLSLPGRIGPAALQEAERFYAGAIEAGYEGVMAKALDSRYTPGARGRGWLKIKHAHTLDLVIVAADWGYGRRHGWLSNYHLAARDPERGGFVEVGKTFKGLTDDQFERMTARLLALKTDETRATVFVRPEVVVEVAYNDIQRSPQYAGAMALRFARIVRVRDDKPAAEADTLAAMTEAFERQVVRPGVGRPPVARPG